MGGAESKGLESPAAFCNPPEETGIMATIRSLATPLQFPPNFPKELNYSVSCSPALTIKSGSRTAAALRLLVHLLQVSRAHRACFHDAFMFEILEFSLEEFIVDKLNKINKLRLFPLICRM